MEYIVKENNKLLFTGYEVRNIDYTLELNILGKKDIDNFLEFYDKDNNFKLMIKIVNYFGIKNYEIYKDNILMATIGEDINLFKDIYFYESLGWKLEYYKDKYIITNIEDNEIAEIIYEDNQYRIINAENEDLLNIVVISLVLFITKKEGKNE